MKPLLVLFLLGMSISPTSYETSADWAAIIAKSPVIVKARVIESSLSYHWLVVAEHWKGVGLEDFNIDASGVSVDEKSEYYIFARLAPNKLELTELPLPAEDAPEALLIALDQLPCQDSTLTRDYRRRNDPNYREGGCLRARFPVCGCDGVRYGSACEAINQRGILRYRQGECDDNRKGR